MESLPPRIIGLPWDPDQPITDLQARQRCLEVGLPSTANWRRVYMPEPISHESCVWLIQTPFGDGLAGLSVPCRVPFRNTPLDRLYRRHTGWRLEYFGKELPPSDQVPPAVFKGVPRVALHNQQGAFLTHLVVYHALAWRQGSTVVAEMRFGPWTDFPPDNWPLIERWAVSGFSRPTAPTEWGDGKGGLALIQLSTGGGGRHTLEDTAWDYWRGQADKAIKLKSRGYTWDQISGNTGHPATTIRTWVRKRQQELAKRPQLPQNRTFPDR